MLTAVSGCGNRLAGFSTVCTTLGTGLGLGGRGGLMVGVNERPGGSSLSGESSNDGIFASATNFSVRGEVWETQRPGGEKDVDFVLVDDGRDISGKGSGDGGAGLLGKESSSIGDRLLSRTEDSLPSTGEDGTSVVSS